MELSQEKEALLYKEVETLKAHIQDYKTNHTEENRKARLGLANAMQLRLHEIQHQYPQIIFDI